MWYVYFLKRTNEDIYVGSTNDLRRRVESHQAWQRYFNEETSPGSFVIVRSGTDERTARKLEIYFKSGSGKAFAKKRFLSGLMRGVE